MGKFLFYGSIALVVLSISLAVFSFYPVAESGKQTSLIIDDTFKLASNETYSHGLGSFHGDENLTLVVSQAGSCPINFTILTYGGQRYSNFTAANITYTFPVGADYYEASFQSNSTADTEVHFQVFAQKPLASYPFSWLGVYAKAMFFVGWAVLMLVILKPMINNHAPSASKFSSAQRLLKGKNLRWLKIAVVVSFIFWFTLLALNTYPLATFENWYTDSARHPYTSVLFMKVGFSVFDTPLGALSNVDCSLYRFVTWPEMPNLYPIGSVLLYLPFGALLEAGISQALVFKMEIALLLAVAHVCLYLFLKRFLKQDLHVGLKALAIYLFYVVLVVYAANGQSDSVAFLFSIIAVFFFVEQRYDLFLLFGAISSTLKYQAGIFLVPFILVSLLRLFQNHSPKDVLKNKAVLAAAGLAALDLFTAYLSAPSLVNARPELVMNVANAFSPHAQIPWILQVIAVVVVLGLTLTCAVYVLNRTRIVSLFAVFALLPMFSMPYFQPWYLLFFFVYTLIPQSKLSMQATVSWIVLVMLILSFGGLAYNPVAILDNVRKVLGF
ncbi:MAG: hypothetical protein NWF00_08555 [Candidatus Bathyarchaeota archaeon]|nr:hypothetical protein [Candidatus Bathyarchaeota archaeon]